MAQSSQNFVGQKETPFARDSVLKDEVVDKLNEALTFKYNTVHILDSAAAYFGSDNVGLCGIAWYFKVASVAEKADAYKVVEFLNSRGAPVKWGKVCEPPSCSEWSKKGKDCTVIVKKAFEKQLAIEKVGLECELKLSKLAMENNDSHTCHFIGCCTEMKAKKVHCLSGIVAHLKSVEGCHHAIKDFDRELECKVECCAKAAGVEAVICCRLQMGVCKRLWLTESFMPSWKFIEEKVHGTAGGLDV
ncbi:hypothetical protein CVIRNUC_007522 [Coccomyxa viridis]|uniref:Ferritin n=1 Tax=Coccomyxa viridis TaxID=1274662 RepID=A0AAV1IEK8_9CHLO|nr:hypothetical protein CVIRNUC_007522 [Coccomyxa viridis]